MHQFLKPGGHFVALLLLLTIAVTSCTFNAYNIPSNLPVGDSDREAFLVEGRAIVAKYGLQQGDSALLRLADSACEAAGASASDWEKYLGGIRSGASTDELAGSAIEVVELAKRTLC